MHWKFAIRKIYDPSGKKIEWFTASALEEIILNSLFIIYLCHSVIFSHFYQIRFQIFGVKRHKRQISETLTEVVIISFNAHRVLVKHFLIYYCSHPEYRRRGLLWCFLMLSYLSILYGTMGIREVFSQLKTVLMNIRCSTWHQLRCKMNESHSLLVYQLRIGSHQLWVVPNFSKRHKDSLARWKQYARKLGHC